MKSFKRGYTRGFSLLEIVIVATIAIVLVTIPLSTFYSLSENQSLEKDVNYVIALIEKARLQTVNAKNNSRFSIRFASTSATLYQGTTYSAGSASNTQFDFSSKVEMSSINLSGNAQAVSFELITGKANATGTIKFRLKNNQSASTTIILYKTGLVEIQ